MELEAAPCHGVGSAGAEVEAQGQLTLLKALDFYVSPRAATAAEVCHYAGCPKEQGEELGRWGDSKRRKSLILLRLRAGRNQVRNGLDWSVSPPGEFN